LLDRQSDLRPLCFATADAGSIEEFGRMAAIWKRLSVLVLAGLLGAVAPAEAAEEYVTGSPGLLCDSPGQIAQTLGYLAENNKKALQRLKGCRLVEHGSPVRIVSRDHAVAKVLVGGGPNPASGYMPIQSITNARGDPID
jgi:hypothetical protein